MTLRSKLVAFNMAIIAPLAVMVLVIGYDFFRLANLDAQEQGLKDRSLANVSTLAREMELLLASEDHAAIRQQLRRFLGEPDLAFAQVWGKGGTVVARVGEGGPAQSLAQVKRRTSGNVNVDGMQVWVWRPVAIEGVPLGAVALGYTLARVQLARSRATLFLGAVIVGALLLVLASFSFSARIVRPVLQITHAFRRMADGDLDQPPVRVVADDEAGQMATAFNEMLPALRQFVELARAIAAGNLDVAVAGKGPLAEAFHQMVASQRQVLQQIKATAERLTTAAREFQSTAERQQQGALEQSAAVEESRRTMDNLIEWGRRVANTAQGVQQTAEKADANSQRVAENFMALATHTQRIGEILQVIKEIANKSDVLALNAALEGTKAGEVGRGFSLVAAQMQRLAENVMASVRDIKELTDTVTEANRATVGATEDSTRLAAQTARAARQIAMTIHEQQAGTEQVNRNMGDVAQIAREVEVASRQVVSSSADLVQLSAQLQELVSRFRMDQQLEPLPAAAAPAAATEPAAEEPHPAR